MANTNCERDDKMEGKYKWKETKVIIEETVWLVVTVVGFLVLVGLVM